MWVDMCGECKCAPGGQKGVLEFLELELQMADVGTESGPCAGAASAFNH